MDLEAVQELEIDVSSDSEEELEVEISQAGMQGYSAYEVAVQNGFEGTEQEWLESLRGSDGSDGTDGVTPTITIGTTTTLDAGSNATVSRTGTVANPVFNFGIPQGIKGDTGDTGATPDFQIGTVQTGNSSSATITGTAEEPVLNLVLQKGDKGDKGDTGTSVLDFRVVQSLPTEDISTTTIYLVRNEEVSGSNLYDEYVYTNNAWEKIGNTSVDLSNYYTKTQIDNLLNNKQNTLQFSTMPTASSLPVNTICQYIGETTTDYKKGHWYNNNSAIYKRLDYATIPSGLYVETQITPTNHKVEVSFAWTSYTSDSHVLGTDGGTDAQPGTITDPSRYMQFTSFNNKYYWGMNGVEHNGGRFSSGDHIVIFNDGEQNQVLLDNSVIDTGLSASQYQLNLFRRSGNANFSGKFYYLKIWNKATNELVRHLVPVKDASGNPAFYDVVTSTTFNTQGSGTITAGNETGETYGSYEWTIVDDYLTEHQDISGKENTSNKVTSLSSSSTDTEYPSAKCVYDLVGDINTVLATLTTPGNGGGN